MTTSGDGRTALGERARQRWRRSMLLGGVLSGVAGGVAPLLLPHHDRPRHTAASTPVEIVVVVVGVLVIAAVLTGAVVLMRWLLSREEGPFAAPLIAGLGRRDRRAAGRAVRRGQVPTDPDVASAALDSATRAVRYRWLTLVPAALVVLCAVQLATTHSAAIRIYVGVCGVVIVSAVLRAPLYYRQARRYLLLAGPDPRPTP